MAGYPPSVVDIALDVRALLLRSSSEVSERITRGWRSINLQHVEAGYVCGVFPGRDRVKVGFEHGHLLYDPNRLLTGNGHQVRYLIVPALTPEMADSLIDFLHQAIDAVG